MDIGPSEAETFWTEFLRKLRRRGLRGVKLVCLRRPRGHQGRRRQADERHLAALPGSYHAQRARPRRQGSRCVVSAFIATAFAQDSAEAAKTQWRKVADQLRPKLPKLSGFMDEAEDDVLAYIVFPPTTGRKSIRPTVSNGSTARSNAGPKSSASSPMTTQSPVWSGRSCWNRTTSGPSSAPAT